MVIVVYNFVDDVFLVVSDVVVKKVVIVERFGCGRDVGLVFVGNGL